MPNRSTPLVLIKANVCRILEPLLSKDGFSVLNGGRAVYFPSNGRQMEFKKQFSDVLSPTESGSEIKSRRVTRKISALRQIEAAIKLFHVDEYESTITLALAAESQLPNDPGPYVYHWFKARVPADIIDRFNDFRNWLKHHTGPDEIEITDLDAGFAILRATTKFRAVFGETSPTMDEFSDWIRQKGGLPPNIA